AADILEQQRRAAGLDDAVVDLRDLELGIDLRTDANELSLALEQGDPLAQVTRRGHYDESTESAKSTASVRDNARPLLKAFAARSRPMLISAAARTDSRWRPASGSSEAPVSSR